MQTFTRTRQFPQQDAAGKAVGSRSAVAASRREDHSLQVNRAIGNQATQRLLQHADLAAAEARSTTSMAPSIVHKVLHSPSQPLDAATRAFFEPRFGHDFSKVRVHADQHAARSASAMDALAYTIGDHVVFGEGRFPPKSPSDHHLLAHELVHTVQQAPSGALSELKVTNPLDASEQAVNRAIDQLFADDHGIASSLQSSPIAVMRQPTAASGPPIPILPNAVIRATWYTYGADDGWMPQATVTDSANVVPSFQAGRPRSFRPVQLHLDLARLNQVVVDNYPRYRAYIRLVIDMNNDTIQVYSWRCEATAALGIYRLDLVEAIPVRTPSRHRPSDPVLGPITVAQSLPPSTSGGQIPPVPPSITVTGSLAPSTTSVTQNPTQVNVGAQGGLAFGAGPQGNVGVTGALVLPYSQSQTTPASAQYAFGFTVDINVRYPPRPAPPPPTPSPQ
jgi:hypothetical protein